MLSEKAVGTTPGRVTDRDTLLPSATTSGTDGVPIRHKGEGEGTKGEEEIIASE